MTVDITTEVQAIFLLVLRNRYPKVPMAHEDEVTVSYEIQERDPVPVGLRVGNWIHGTFKCDPRTQGKFF